MPTKIYSGPINKNAYCDESGKNFVSVERDFTEGFSLHMRSVVEGDRNAVHNIVAANARGNIDQQRHAVYLYQVDSNGNLCNYDYTNTWFKQSLDKLGVTSSSPLAENIAALSTITDATELTKVRNFCSAPFQWLKFSVTWNDDSVKPIDGFIVLKKMPRAVSFLPAQETLLKVYEKLGLISAPNNDESIKWVGQHRTINDAAMLEMRVLDNPDAALPTNVLKSVIDTTVTFCEQMTNDGYVAHYPTDLIKDKAIGVMCYSASDVQAPGYREAGFMEVQDPSIEQLFPGPDASATNECAGYGNALRKETGGRLFFRNFDNHRNTSFVDDATTITLNANTVGSSPVVRLHAEDVNPALPDIFRKIPVCRP
jgi:hypothetical protein